MMKPASFSVVHSRSLAAFALLWACLVSIAEAKPNSPITPSDRVISILNPRLQAHMLQILNDYQSFSKEDMASLNGVKGLISRAQPVLRSSEAEQAITILYLYTQSSNAQYSALAEGLLVALGDPHAITNAVAGLSTESLSQIRKARSDLSKSGQPRVVVALGEMLFRDEAVRLKRLGEDTFVAPESVEATQIVLDILSSCDEFPPAVSSWASKLRRIEIGKRREFVRQWWKQNEKAMREGRFSDTLPPPENGTSHAPGPQESGSAGPSRK